MNFIFTTGLFESTPRPLPVSAAFAAALIQRAADEVNAPRLTPGELLDMVNALRLSGLWAHPRAPSVYAATADTATVQEYGWGELYAACCDDRR